MQRRFVIKGFIARFKKVRNGYLIAVGEPALNNLSKPTYEWVSIWGPKARAIAPKLRKGREFEFRGDIIIKQKDGKTYLNHTVDQWVAIPPKPWKTQLPRERDDDWFVPKPVDRDQRAHRLAEGFDGHKR